jgi:hypothetical protein
MKTKHTPAPWHLMESRKEAMLFCDNEKQVVASLICPVKADLKLIAAAPDLLEALIEMIELCTFIAPDISSNLIDNAHAAIAKATQ